MSSRRLLIDNRLKYKAEQWVLYKEHLDKEIFWWVGHDSSPESEKLTFFFFFFLQNWANLSKLKISENAFSILHFLIKWFRIRFSYIFSYKIIDLVRTKMFQKNNISYPLTRTRTCGFQGVGNVSFSGNFVYILNMFS